LDTILHDWPEVAAEFSLYGESHHTYDLENIRTRLVDKVSTMSATIPLQNNRGGSIPLQNKEKELWKEKGKEGRQSFRVR
jgi:hypothetical protein